MTGDPAINDEKELSTARVFISYSRKDLAFVDRLDSALKARGFEPLVDRSDIYAFEEWWKRIEVLIARADTVVFVLSPDAVTSNVALKEVAFAASLNKRFAPIVCRPVDDRAIPEPLARLNFIVFDQPSRWEDHADQLAQALKTDLSWVRQHTEFTELARRWALANRATGLLLRSPLLEQSEAWLSLKPSTAPAPTDEMRAYIAESRRRTSTLMFSHPRVNVNLPKLPGRRFANVRRTVPRWLCCPPAHS